MNDDNVAFRLKGFIDSQELSHSQFADTCGIPRPSLSQILSGRNKKVSDVIVGQIHRAFPNLSIMWLLFGEGAMIVPTPGSADQGGSDGDSSFDSVNDSKGVRPMGASLFDSDSLFDEAAFGDVSSSVAIDFNSSRGTGQKGTSWQKNVGDNPKNMPRTTDANEFPNVRDLESRLERLKYLENQLVDNEKKIAELQSQIEFLRANPRKVSHITVYYEDSTFETFQPKR